MFKFLMTVLTVILVSCFSIAYADEGLTESDSGIRGPTYTELEAYFAELETAYPWLMERVVYGRTVQGRNLNALKIKYKNINNPGAPFIFISGATHGDEYLNIVDRLPQWFIETGIHDATVQSYLNAGGEILLVPVMNPDGYTARRRHNSNNKDLNRDYDNLKANYKGFTQPETTALAQLIYNEVTSQSLRFAVSVDYHCCSGDFLHPYSYRGPVMPEQDLLKYSVVRDISLTVFGNEIGYGTTPTLLGYDAIGTSKDYFYETYGSASFTFEGRFSRENAYFNTHTAFWIQIMNTVLSGRL